MRYRVGNVFGMEDNSEKARCGGSFGWILRLFDVSGEPLGRLNTCHHSGADQILTTTTTFLVLLLPFDMCYFRNFYVLICHVVSVISMSMSPCLYFLGSQVL